MKSVHAAIPAALLIALVLCACSKKDSPDTAAASPAPASTSDTPRFKSTEKFGSVSNIDLEPVFQVPSRYADYVHQQASELAPAELRQLGDADAQKYVKTWLTQATSVDKPDWSMLAAITHPAVIDEGNEFKKQAVADQVKTELKPDAKSLDMVFGWQGEVLSVDGLDVSDGEYYLTIRPDNRFSTVSYTNAAQYGYALFYKPVFNKVGMTGDNRGDMQITVKVPIDKAREIEALREGGVPMMRVYGHVVGPSTTHMPVLRKNFSDAALDVEVEAIEFGMRKDGTFKTFFFLDTDQLKKSKA